MITEKELFAATGNTNNVQEAGFQLDWIVGKKIDQVLGMELNFGTSYPTVNDNGICTGIVDGNYPLDFADGQWEIIDNTYAMAL